MDKNKMQDEQNEKLAESWANRIIKITYKILKKLGQSKGDNYHRMCFLFLSKQLDHMQSVASLKSTRDGELVLRSMLEGIFFLHWAAGEPEKRSMEWMEFFYVDEWRKLKIYKRFGKHVDEDYFTEIEKNLKEKCNKFMTAKSKKKYKMDKELPNDPYLSNWTGCSIRKLSELVKGDEIYANMYRQLSGWQHWSSAYFGRSLVADSDGVTYCSGSHKSIMFITIGAMLALANTANLVDKHFNLGHQDDIKAIQEEYRKWDSQNESNAEDNCT